MAKRKIPLVTVVNHNGTIIYQGNCIITAAAEVRLYEYHMQVKTVTTIEWVKA